MPLAQVHRPQAGGAGRLGRRLPGLDDLGEEARAPRGELSSTHLVAAQPVEPDGRGAQERRACAGAGRPSRRSAACRRRASRSTRRRVSVAPALPDVLAGEVDDRARRPGARASSIVPASMSHCASPGPAGPRRTRRTSSWPALGRAPGRAAVPIRPGRSGDRHPHGSISIQNQDRVGRQPSRLRVERERIGRWTSRRSSPASGPARRSRVEVLGGGITNHNFKVDAAGGPYVLRIAGRDTALLGIDRSVEHEASLAAAAVGVGPEVVAFVEPEGYLVTRFIEGVDRPRRADARGRSRSGGSRRRCARCTAGLHCRRASSRSGSSRTTARRRSRTEPRCRRATRGRARSRGGSSGHGERSRSGPATTTCSTRTSSTTASGSGSSTGSTPAWATSSSTSPTSRSTTGSAATSGRRCSRPTSARSGRRRARRSS